MTPQERVARDLRDQADTLDILVTSLDFAALDIHEPSACVAAMKGGAAALREKADQLAKEPQ